MIMYRLSQAVTAASTAASKTVAAGALAIPSCRTLAGPPPSPKKIECFIDGKKVLVDPGTTVLQVNKQHMSTLVLLKDI